jgi:hypothetical protein
LECSGEKTKDFSVDYSISSYRAILNRADIFESTRNTKCQIALKAV